MGIGNRQGNSLFQMKCLGIDFLISPVCGKFSSFPTGSNLGNEFHTCVPLFFVPSGINLNLSAFLALDISLRLFRWNWK